MSDEEKPKEEVRFAPQGHVVEAGIKGHDIRIPMPNDDDFERRVEWQIDSPHELKPGGTRDPTRIFYKEQDVRNYLCWQMLVASFDKTVCLNLIVRRVERFLPKEREKKEPVT